MYNLLNKILIFINSVWVQLKPKRQNHDTESVYNLKKFTGIYE